MKTETFTIVANRTILYHFIRACIERSEKDASYSETPGIANLFVNFFIYL